MPAYYDPSLFRDGAMAYQSAISRQSPACLVFVVDQSASMNMRIAEGPSKATFLADVINKTIYTLITNCTKAEGVRDYFLVGVIGYSGFDARSLLGELPILSPMSTLASNPLRIEERTKKISDDRERQIEQKVRFPIWLEPKSSGKTSMCAGLSLALQLVRDWCHQHPNGYPPTVLHVTDGHPTDGDPEPIATKIKTQCTEDGNVLLYTLHVDIGSRVPALFPGNEGSLADKYGKKLFRMSSVLPRPVRERAAKLGYQVFPDSRGFMFNAGLHPIVDFFELGTRANVTPDR